jgi:hypothetical protein
MSLVPVFIDNTKKNKEKLTSELRMEALFPSEWSQ